jgi:hypothetical protein
MLDKVFDRITAEQTRLAHELASKKPGEGKDIGYEYGYRQGIYAGLDHAKQLIESILRDQDKHDNNL